ncbi:UreD urease accessory protein-domain-containing protein [Amanita rubescens]|nr:UreD urease accessory protein-domain-containing protein [Amanita rubescens]
MIEPHFPPSQVPKIQAGNGRIALCAQGRSVAFSELSAAYPLKLLSPRAIQDNVAIVYVLTYGGGLVGGDQLKLHVNIEAHEAVLVLLSQGSTKVFKTRPGQRLADVSRSLSAPAKSLPPEVTSQIFNFDVASGSMLALLMDPVSCFRSASYTQVQTFHLEDERASVVVLDWITSGRKVLGEEWAFSRYYSCNEIWVGQKRVMRDIMLLEDDSKVQENVSVPHQSLLERLAPYSCYATVFFYGPMVRETVSQLSRDYESISLLWSLSPVASKDGSGAVLRVAALETEMVKNWLSTALKGLKNVIGSDVYRRAFA